MSDSTDQRDVGTAVRTLAYLVGHAERLRTRLARLLEPSAQVRRQRVETRARQLVEVNEQLVIAALDAQSVADATTSHLVELTRSSQRDALTGTPKRELMLDRLQTAIARSQRHTAHLAVLFLDMDDFKSINDTRGHAAGDQALQRIARALESVVRDSDTISRYGGDEFVVLLAELAQPADAALIAGKMLSVLATADSASAPGLGLSASIGIAIYPEDGQDAAILIDRADAAMYRSKRRGPGGFAFYAQGSANDRHPDPSAMIVDGRIAPVREQSDAGPDPRFLDLREANEQLLIAALTAQRLEAQAAEANRQQFRFLAMVAHELRNPLAPMRIATELLARAHASEPFIAELPGIIEHQVAQLTRLIDDLVDGSRINAGKFGLERGTVEINAILKMAVETCRPALDARLQHLNLQLLSAPLSLHGDPVRLVQIFSNLLDNASKYTPDGGQISLVAQVHEHTLTIAVSDNGIGITAEALPTIFDLFVQDARTPGRRNNGLGIGLAVVRELAQAHSGTVMAASAGRNLGSEFVVTLPLRETSAVESRVEIFSDTLSQQTDQIHENGGVHRQREDLQRGESMNYLPDLERNHGRSGRDGEVFGPAYSQP